MSRVGSIEVRASPLISSVVHCPPPSAELQSPTTSGNKCWSTSSPCCWLDMPSTVPSWEMQIFGATSYRRSPRPFGRTRAPSPHLRPFSTLSLTMTWNGSSGNKTRSERRSVALVDGVLRRCRIVSRSRQIELELASAWTNKGCLFLNLLCPTSRSRNL